MDPKTTQEEHTCKFPKGRHDNHVCFDVVSNPSEKWGEILYVQMRGELNLSVIITISYPKDGVEFSSCKILDLYDAVGEVVDSWHTWQSLETALDESE